jgi:hypothetical protein
MILALAWTYIPVVVVFLLWAVAMRPVLRLIHLAPCPPKPPAFHDPAFPVRRTTASR